MKAEFQSARIPFSAVSKDELALFAASPDPEGRWGWFKTLAETTLEPGEDAALLVLRQDTELCAALPVAQSRGGALRGLTAPYTTLFAPPLGTPEEAHALGLALKAYVPTTLRLDALDEQDASMRSFLAGLSAGGLLIARYRHFANFFDIAENFETFWKTRDPRLQSTVRRKTRALQRDHAIEFRLLSSPVEMEEGAALYERIYAASWKQPEPHPDFIASLLRALAEEGAVRLGFLFIDGEAAAVQLWLTGDSRATIFKLAHDPKFEKQSPGTILSHWLLERLVSERITQFDFGRGDDGYKRGWLGQYRFRGGVIVCNPRSLVGIGAAIRYVLPTRLGNAFRKY